MTLFSDSLSLTGTYSRSDPDGVYFAFIEWLILSEMSVLINTYGSTFAVEASHRHLVPLVGVWNHIGLHHNDVRLPFCGHMQFIKVSDV